MASRWFDKEEFFAKLEQLGEDKVRENLVAKVYGDAGNKRAFAQEWLAQKDRSRNQASNFEQARTARSAKNAAWAAAIAAIIAAICAIVSIVIALN